MTVKRRRIKVGDVFSIPLDDERTNFGFCQVARAGKVLYVILFDASRTRGELKSEPVALEPITSSPLVFVGRTMDALIYHGRWIFIGNDELPGGIPYPPHKVAQGEKKFIESFDGKQLRAATKREFEEVPYKSSSAPIAFQNAIRAHFGFIEWTERFDEFKVDRARWLEEEFPI